MLDFYGYETERCHNLKFFILNSSLLVFVSVYIHFGYSLERSKNQKIESNIGQIIRRVWLFLIKTVAFVFRPINVGSLSLLFVSAGEKTSQFGP